MNQPKNKMILDYATYESKNIDLIGSGFTSLNDFRKLAVRDEIKDIDYKMVNKIALYAHNKFKKSGSFKSTLVLTVENPYKLWGITECDILQFIIDKKTYNAYYNRFQNGNITISQIVCNENSLILLSHEIQHIIYGDVHGTHDYVNDVWDLGEIMKIFDIKFDEIKYNQNNEFNDVYCFFHIIYVLFPDEIESNIVEIYQQLLNLKTTRRTFNNNLKKCISCEDYFDILQEKERGSFIDKWRKSPSYRVDFFSQIKFLFDNMNDVDKIKLKANPLFKRLFFKDYQIKVLYDKKISQKEADAESKFWTNHLKNRTDQALRKVKLMKYLFKNDEHILYP